MPKYFKYCFLLAFFILVGSLYSQKLTISGYVKDKNSGETLPGANIYISNLQTGTSTNQFGFFSLSAIKGENKIIASYVGFLPQLADVILDNDTTINFNLDNIMLQAIEILASRSAPVSQSIGRVNIPMARIKEIPSMMGESDIMKALALTAGVSIGTEGTSGLYVRGGSPDQNLIMLDGATVYNTSHLFGFLSVFNPDAIKSVELIKGGFPAKYGGRLSSVIDITMKEGNNQKRETSYSISPLSSHFTTEGPISKGKSSYMISGRTAYLSLLALPLYLSFKKNNSSSYINYWMYDLNLKYNYTPDEKHRLFLSVYLGNDKLTSKQREDGLMLNYPLSWGNRTLSIRYTNVLRPTIFSSSQMTYNYFQFSFRFFEEADKIKIENPVSLKVLSSVRDFSFKQQFDWNYSKYHYFNIGAEVIQQSFRPDFVKIKNIEGITDSTLAQKNNHINALSIALYANDRITINDVFQMEVGLRTPIYILPQKTYLSIEPRLSFITNTSKSSAIKLSLSFMNQPIHLLTSSSSGLPNDVWLPSTSKIKPESAWQVAIGYKKELSKTISVTSEVYYKMLFNTIDYSEGTDFMATLSNNWEQNIETGGHGKAYGYELFFTRSAERYQVQAAYTLSWNLRKFTNINEGAWYPHKYDRRHDISITGTYTLNNNWKFSGTWIYMTGQATTLPSAWMEDINGELIPVYTGRNQQRMPTYHRLDAAFINTYKTRKGNLANFTLGVYNAYAHKNPFAVELLRYEIYEYNGVFVNYTGFETKLSQYTLFSFMPYLSYALKF